MLKALRWTFIGSGITHPNFRATVGNDITSPDSDATASGADVTGLGQLDALAGARERSTESLTAAVAMFRNLGMSYWQAQAESALRRPAASPSPR